MSNGLQIQILLFLKLSRHSQNHMNSPVEGREPVSTHSLTHCYCSTGTLFQSLKMFHQPCFLQKPQSRRDLWHLRMRLNLCFSKLLKMRSHNITERREAQGSSYGENERCFLESSQQHTRKTRNKPRTPRRKHQRSGQHLCPPALWGSPGAPFPLLSDVPCKVPNSLPTALSPPNFTKSSFLKQDQHKTAVFEQLTSNYLLSLFCYTNYHPLICFL